jgi:integrase
MTRTLPKHIFKRGHNYAVRFTVPVEVRSVVGKKEIVRSLGTRDLGEALVKRNSLLEEIKTSLFAEIDEPASTRGTTKANKRATISPKVRDTAHQWLSESDGINGSTRNRYRSILEAFEDFSENTDVTKIDREMALRFIDHLKTTPSAKTGHLLAHRTLQAYQICLSSYWRILDHKGLVDPNMRNPFSSLLRRLAGQKKKIDPRKKNLRPVTRTEAESLLAYIASNEGLKYKHEMYATVRLLWVTACRLNEIVGLKLSEIDDHGDHMALRITNAKTDAGNRIVMIVGEDDCELLRDAVSRAKVTKPRLAGNKRGGRGNSDQ